MIAIAHFIAVSFYLGAAAVAALPFARRVKAPVGALVIALLLGLKPIARTRSTTGWPRTRALGAIAKGGSRTPRRDFRYPRDWGK